MVYVTKSNNFEEIRLEWEALLPHCSTNTIFLTPKWQSVWWKHFGAGFELCIITVQDENEILGIAPLMLKDGIITFIGHESLFDYQDFLVKQDYEDKFFKSLSDYLFNMNWHTMNLTSIPESSSTLNFFINVFENKINSLELNPDDTTPVSHLTSSWDEYLFNLSKKQRHELKRKLRRLENVDTFNQYLCDTNDIESSMSDFLDLMALSNPEKKDFLTIERQSFFKDVASELSLAGQFKLYFMEIDGKRVAGCICFDYANSYLLYNSGYNPKYAHLSVGLLNKAICIKDAIKLGRDSFNFLKGSERYKYDLGAKNKITYRLKVDR